MGTIQYLIVFLISTFQLQQFPRFQGDPRFTLGCPVPLCTPHNGKNFVLEASTLLCLMAFSISTFQLLYFPRYKGGPKLTLGALRPLDAPIGEIFLHKASTSQYLIVFLISTFQLLYFPRYQGGPKFTLEGLMPTGRPLSEKFFYPRRVLHNIFCTLGEYVTMSNSVSNFNFLALVFFEMLGRSQIYNRGPYTPVRRLPEKFFNPKRVLHNI